MGAASGLPSINDASRDLILAIEAAVSRAWPSIEREALCGWVLRCGRAGSRRLNSVQTLAFDAAADVGAAIDAAAHWYGERRLPPCFQLTDAVQPSTLDASLDERGYASITPTSVMTTAEWPSDSGGDEVRIELLPRADARVLKAICDPSWSAHKLSERVDLFRRIESPHVFALVVDDGEPVAGGMCAVDGALAGLFTMRTQAAQRRRGLARALALRLIGWACEQRAQRLYLQVEDDNGPALRLYRHLGFVREYGYHYRERAAP